MVSALLQASSIRSKFLCQTSPSSRGPPRAIVGQSVRGRRLCPPGCQATGLGQARLNSFSFGASFTRQNTVQCCHSTSDNGASAEVQVEAEQHQPWHAAVGDAADKLVLKSRLPVDVKRDSTLAKEDVLAVAKERFLGRVAVLGLGAVLLGERLTGRGAVEQLDLATGVPLWEMDMLLAALVVFLLYHGLRPGRIEHQPLEKKPASIAERFQALCGRFACVGLASTIMAEVSTGKGALALLDLETGVEYLNEFEAATAFIVMLFLTQDVKANGEM